MKVFTSCLAMLLLSAAVSAQASQLDTAAPITLTGYMAVSDEWNDASTPVPYYGFYKFSSDGSSSITSVSPTGYDYAWASCGAVYSEGKYYCYSVDSNASWMNYTLSYYVIDAATWSVDTSAGFKYKYSDRNGEEAQKAIRVPSAVLYNPITDKYLAFTHKFANSESGAICSFDTATGELTYIADTPFIKSAACDANGVVYGIDKNGNVLKFASDWSNTVVVNIGMTPSSDSELGCGAAIDFRTNIMYWSLYGTTADSATNGAFALVGIDLNDNSYKLLFNYPRNERFASLSVQNSHPLAPDNIADLNFTPAEAGSTTGVITFTVPSVTYSQTAITSAYECEWFIDNVSQGTLTVNPGAKFSQNIEGLADGNHTASIVLRANGHASNVAYATAFFGVDTPQAVQDLTFTYDEATSKTTLTWTPSSVGANGGLVNTDDLRYKITRYPDKTLVARSAKGTSFTEVMTEPYDLYYYTVQAYTSSNSSQIGKTATSNKLKAGADRTIPYTQTFDTEASLDAYTMIDANGDGSDSWEAPCWKYDSTYYCAFYYGKSDHPADDWLITPALNLNPDKLYKFIYKYYAYYGYGSRLRVAMGAQPTVEGMDYELLDKSFYSSFSDYPGLTETVIFCPNEDTRFLGIQHLSTTQEHLSIDDIEIVEYMDATVPGAVDNLTATEQDDETIKIAFNLPSLNAGRRTLEGPLKVQIFKSDNPSTAAATFTGKNPGDAIEWIDENAVKAVNSYTIYATNSYGDGLEATISLDLSTGVPTSTGDVEATLINPNQVLIEWVPTDSEVAEDGRKVNLETVRYNIYKEVMTSTGAMFPTIARDLVDCQFIDNDPNQYYEDSQNLVIYYVAPVNETGEGALTAANGVFTGQTYALPFEESWAGQMYHTYPWSKTLKDNATWYMRYKGFDPMVDSYDGSGVYDCETDYEQTDGSCGLVTPRIDFTSLKNPVLSFRMWRAPSYEDDVNLKVCFDDGTYIYSISGQTYTAKYDEEGWYLVQVPLDNFTSYSCASIVLYATVKEDNTIHIDDFKITGDALDAELELTALSGITDVRTNEEARFTATVKNIGSTTATAVDVAFSVDNKAKETKQIASLAPGEEQTVTYTYVPTTKETGMRTVRATISDNAADNSTENNEMKALIYVAEQNHPYITTLEGNVAYTTVTLKWGFPDTADNVESVLDEVESYTNFSIDDFGAWSVYDGDGGVNYRLQDPDGNLITWTNYDKPQAFIVFDPSELDSSSTPFTPYSGSQSFVSWSSTATGGNNDWLISPELPGYAQLVSFLACSAVSGTESFYFLASSTGKDPADFVKLTGASASTTSTSWDAYRYAVPEGTKYFAINYVGSNGYGIALDDFRYDGYPLAVRPDGYNVYRNDVKLNDKPISARKYVDSEAQENTKYTYTVAPVFNGVEARKSNAVSLTTAGVETITSDSAAASVEARNSTIYITNANGRHISVCSASGAIVASYNGVDQAQVAVAPGVYIVKVADKVVKLIVK